MEDEEVVAIERHPYAGTSLLSQAETGISRPSLTLDVPDRDLHKATERSPLLRSATSHSRSRSRRRQRSVGPHGDATVTQAVLMVCSIPVIMCRSVLIPVYSF